MTRDLFMQSLSFLDYDNHLLLLALQQSHHLFSVWDFHLDKTV